MSAARRQDSPGEGTPGLRASRGFAVTAGLDPDLAAALGARCAELGYGSLWSNDHPAADGFETMAALAAGAGETAGQPPLLGIAGVALARREPAEIAAAVERAGFDPARLLLAVGAGTVARDSVDALRAALPELRAALPRVRLLAGAAPAGDGVVELAGELFDGALVEWMSPALIDDSRARLEAGATRVGREPPTLIGYVRVAAGADAETRLARDEGFYRAAPGWHEHFARLPDPGRTGVACDRPGQVAAALEPYRRALDTVVVRGLAAATRLSGLERIARAAAPDAAEARVSRGRAVPSATP